MVSKNILTPEQERKTNWGLFIRFSYILYNEIETYFSYTKIIVIIHTITLQIDKQMTCNISFGS